MSVKLGNTSINGLFLGNVAINKAFLGNTEIFSTSAPNGLLNNLVSYYKMDTNGSFSDAHGSNNGIINGATFTASGKINGGYNFDGVNDYITINNSAQLKLQGQYSISFWIKYTSGNRIIDKSTALTTNGYGLVIYGQIFWAHKTNNNNEWATGYVPPVGIWTHITCVYDGVNQLLYVNGVLNGSTPQTNNISSNNDNVYIGTYNAGAGQFINGGLDEMGIWEVGLTQEQVTELYNSNSGLSYDNFTT